MRFVRIVKNLLGRCTVGGVSTTLSLLLLASLIGFGAMIESKRHTFKMALGENIYHEGRGESPRDQMLIGMITLARAADTDKQWPKTLLDTITQDRAFSWVLDHKIASKRGEKQKWETAVEIAGELRDGLGTKYLMPKGWECVRYYKRTDNKGVSEKSRLWFEKALVPVGQFGSHTAYREKRGCKTPMRTV